MTTSAQRKKHERWLKEVTSLPTAAGYEDRIMHWVASFVEARRDLALRPDRAGNLVITQKRRCYKTPICITAHMDHPAFVVRKLLSSREVELEFRGGVQDAYFRDARIDIFDCYDCPHRATITSLDSKTEPFKRVKARFSRTTKSVLPGDIGRWALREVGHGSIVKKGILYAPACDDVAAVAAALAALDVLRKRKSVGDVSVLLTRAEEVGFIGAIAACKLRSVSKRARIICLENSRSFPESPIGSGPIVRVGDKTSVFSPQLTNRISAIMTLHQQQHPSFQWQRKLMPGGTCEATAFASYGYESTCLCLPMGNYHNMVDIDGVANGGRKARVGPEYVSVSDYHGLVEMLIVCCTQLDSAKVPQIKTQMERRIAERGSVVGFRRKRRVDRALLGHAR